MLQSYRPPSDRPITVHTARGLAHKASKVNKQHGSDPKTGQRRQFRKAGFATKREAASAVAELKTKLDKGTYVKPTAQTLGEYAQEWLPRRERSDKGLRATTVGGYRRLYRGRHRTFCAGPDEADRHTPLSRLRIPWTI